MALRGTAGVTLTFLLVILVGNGSCQSLTQSQRMSVDRTILQIMRCAKIPSLGLSFISLDGSLMYSRGYGSTDANGQSKVDEHSVFCLGGATQAFTAVLLAKLIDENENVTWNTPVQDILGRRVVLPDLYRSNNLNLKDILAMRSGLTGMDIVSVTKPYNVRGLETRLRYVPEVSGFRESFVYNEILYALVEEVVQALGGDSWYNLIRSHILQPLEMRTTTFIGTFQPRSTVNVVKGVVYFDGKPQQMMQDAYNGLELVGPASSLCTSSADMSRWMRFLLYEGRGIGNSQLIREEALKMTYQAIQPRGYGGPEIQGYRQPDIQISYTRDHNALGWISGQYRGFSFVSQDGSLPGYQSLATIFPKRNLAVFTAFTGDGGPKALAAKVLVNILGIDTLIMGNPWFNDNDVCTIINNMEALESKRENPYHHVYRTQTAGLRPLEDFVGFYRNFAFGDITVSLENNSTKDNTLILEYGLGVYRLETTNVNNTFQLMAKGSLWYSTNADMYRKNSLLAIFSSDPRDPEQRVSDVTIVGFDRHIDPVFSNNPRAPRYEEFKDDTRCSACNIVTSLWTLALLLISVFCLR